MREQTFLIVGAGQAGAMAAKSLREMGYTGRVVLVGRESHPPYERPPLSKAVLGCAPEPNVEIFAADLLGKYKVELLPGVEVTDIGASQRSALLSSGIRVDYDKCLLTTGGDARIFDILPPDLGCVHYVRTLDDARRLRASLVGEPRVVIIGGGFLGLEVASSAASRSAKVTVIEYSAALLTRFIPADAGDWLEMWLKSTGVKLELGRRVKTAVKKVDGALILSLDDGRVIEADQVVVAIGLVVNTRLASLAGLKVDRVTGGVIVDHACRTSDPCIFAAGDCASRIAVDGGVPVRLESWQNANVQAHIAAAGMLEKEIPGPVYPWFWTDQGPHNLQMFGMPEPDLTYSRRGELAGETPRVLWIGHREGIPIHGVALNSGSELRAARILFERKLPVDFGSFSNPSIRIRDWIKTASLSIEPTAQVAQLVSGFN
jgi:NADPH-dependent 2,4-dienoyl-CoA reductase/sulfur reductase-like enzyme